MTTNQEALAAHIGGDVGEILKRLQALEAKQSGCTGGAMPTRNLVYVSRSELLAQNSVTALANNTDYNYTFPRPFAKKPNIIVQFDLPGRYIPYVHSITERGFKFACSYALGIQGLWYEAQEI